MKILKLLCFIAMLWLIPLVQSHASETKILIIAGHGGLDKFQVKFYEQAVNLRQILMRKFGYTAEDIAVFVAENPDSAKIEFPQNTAANIEKYFTELAKKNRTENSFYCFLIGHGSYDNEWSKFNIVGKDLRDFDFALLLNRLRLQKICFINMASASGPFITKLSKKNRVVITATRNGFEKNATQFADQFLDALANADESDLNKDGLLSMTEAFIATRDRIVKFYDSKKQLRPEHPLLDDDGDGFGTEMPDLLEGDGLLAGEFFLNQTEPDLSSAMNKNTTENAVANQQKEKLLEKIKALKKQKSTFAEDEYYDALEKLMIELARVNQHNN